MNIKRIAFWAIFVIIIGLIVWGLAVAMKKSPTLGKASTPPPVTADDHVKGSLDAPVVLIEYSDFQCPACYAYYSFVGKLLQEEGGKIAFVYRHFPLDNILPNGTIQHPNAVPTALASEAAGLQGKFWEMYDAIFSGYYDWVDLKDPNNILVGYAENIGLDVEKFKTDMKSPDLKAKVQNNKNDGIRIGVNSTPTFFVNGTAITNPNNYDQFKAIILEAINSR